MFKWLLVFALLFGLTGCYYADQGRGQLRLRLDQVPINEAIRNETDPKVKELLSQVSAIKSFGQNSLGLADTENFQGYYATKQPGITFVVTAAPKTELTPYTWWFPIIGSVPYKGFFDPQDAQQLKQELEAQGLDVYIFAAPAYSSLGWFLDPVTTPMLASGTWGLADTILHEMAHNTIYVEGQGDFNEQLASFVGVRGAEAFVTQKAGWSADKLQRFHQRRARYKQAQALIHQTLPTFEALYQNQTLSKDEQLAQRDVLFKELAQGLKELTGKDWRLNNARLLQFRRYKEDNPLFENTFKKAQQDWTKFWVLIEEYSQSQGW